MILASQSPRRKELLEELGFKLKIISPNIEETSLKKDIEDQISDIAQKKCEKISENYPEEYIIGADTVVYKDEKVFGKPRDEEEAFEMLESLSGEIHKVITSYCILNKKLGIKIISTDTTEVKFKPLSHETIKWYISTGEPLDKAGAYGIQGKGSILVEKINGDFFTVMGLPIGKVVDSFMSIGFKINELNKI